MSPRDEERRRAEAKLRREMLVLAEADAMGKQNHFEALQRATFTISIHLKSGTGLLAADKNGKSDPYVVAALGKMKRKSSVIKKTLDPVWDEVLTFKGIDEAMLRNEKLCLKCYDLDVPLLGMSNLMSVSSDDLGMLHVSLAPLLTQPSVAFHEVLDTQGALAFTASTSMHGEASALQQLAAARGEQEASQGPASVASEGSAGAFEAAATQAALGEESTEFGRGVELATDSTAAVAQHMLSTGPPTEVYPSRDALADAAATLAIELSVVAGRNLVARDSKGVLNLGMGKKVTSDPYVVCTYGIHRFKTAVASKTLHPTWNARCTWLVEGARFDPQAHLIMAIFDCDQASLDDPMGELQLRMADLMEEGAGIEDVWYPVRACKGATDATGELQVRVVVHPATDHETGADDAAATVVQSRWRGGKARKELRLHPSANQQQTRSASKTSPRRSLLETSSKNLNALKQKGASSVDKGIENLKEKTIASAVDAALSKVGDLIKQSLKENEVEPEWLGKIISEARETMWADITQIVKDAVLVGSEDRRFSKSITQFRNARAPVLSPSPSAALTWLRAKVLYTIVPSDASPWDTVVDYTSLALRLLMLFPGVNSLIFALLFCMMYKRDEYQLINFIVMSRSYQCVTNGLGSLITAGLLYKACLREVDSREEQPAPNLHSLCADSTPADFPETHLAQAQLALRPLAILLVWIAHFLLVSGYARGGKAALKVYEEVRNDAADGSLDGFVNVERASQLSMLEQEARLRRESLVRSGSQDSEDAEARQTDDHARRFAAASHASSHTTSDGAGVTEAAGARVTSATELDLVPQVSLEEKHAMVERTCEASEWKQSKRSKMYTKRVAVSFIRYGGRLRYLFAYDVLCCLLSYYSYIGEIRGAHHGWMMWTNAFYWNATYSCLMFPYMLLLIPFISSIISQGAQPTGYDASGFIGAMLSPAQIQELHRLTEIERRKRQQLREAEKLARKVAALIDQGVDPKRAEQIAQEQMLQKEGSGGGWLGCVWPKQLKRSDLGEAQDTAPRKAAFSYFEAEASAIAQKVAATRIGALMRGRKARKGGKEGGGGDEGMEGQRNSQRNSMESLLGCANADLV